ncbi:MAG: AmmeMemoRadiSam system radical SAM enzyme [Bacteroidales bacterium]|nr:AmmeMemoRadiSam system radical SAM enzyme [Bacteroidales bacterium]
MVPLYKTLKGKSECLLCPHFCKMEPGKSGICGVRKNVEGEIVLQTYGVLSGLSPDPVEKKPLYHFFPGYNILSAGSYGCNMRCDFCQNYHISQNIPERKLRKIKPEELVREALSADKNIGLAFTYNEPVIWFEFMRDAAVAAKEAGLYTVMVSNGYVNPAPLSEITGFIDGFNIDLKSFSSRCYRELTGADIEPVKNGLKQIASSGKHLEITTLIIPGQNDSEKEMAEESEWIAGELGRNVPFHLSRYFPVYKRGDPATPQKTIERLAHIASQNLDHVYIGNINSESGQNTICPGCGTTVTKRSGYKTEILNLDDQGRCTGCGNVIYRYFSANSL